MSPTIFFKIKSNLGKESKAKWERRVQAVLGPQVKESQILSKQPYI